MIGTYDFCGHYDWTFAWLERQGGGELVRLYWEEAIAADSQQHAAQLIEEHGLEGMKAYWGHSLSQEAAGYATSADDATFRLDIHDCPSKGFLLRNGLHSCADYCDHCMGWIGPVMEQAGYVIDHQHNHQGQCWWEMRRREDSTPPSGAGEMAGEKDVRLREDWDAKAGCECPIDTYSRATRPEQKS